MGELCCNFLKKKPDSIDLLKVRQNKADGSLPLNQVKMVLPVNIASFGKKNILFIPKEELRSVLFLSIFHTTTTTSNQKREKSVVLARWFPNCFGNITWNTGSPDRGLLPNLCVWSKLTSFTASWAEAPVKVELRPFICSTSKKPISKGSNSYRDIIASVSPWPTFVAQVTGCGSSYKVARPCLLDLFVFLWYSLQISFVFFMLVELMLWRT